MSAIVDKLLVDKSIVDKGLSIKIGSRSDIGGQKTNQEDNQDALWIFKNHLHNICVFGVLDGHDKDTGKVAADAGKEYAETFTSENIELAISDPICFLENIFAGIHNIIRDTLCNYWRKKGFEIKVEESGIILKKQIGLLHNDWRNISGGTTKSMIMIVGNKMYIANVGDSTGLLCSSSSNSSSSSSSNSKSKPVLKKSFLTYEKDVQEPSIIKSNRLDEDIGSNTLILTLDHSPENPEEFIRCRKQNPSMIDPLKPSLNFIYDNITISNKSCCPPIFDIGENGIPIKRTTGITYNKNVRKEASTYVSTPSASIYKDSLAVTRSLGDFNLGTFGLGHKPEIQSVNLETVFETVETVFETVETVFETVETVETVEAKTICIVLATDGVWDNWTYKDVSEFVMDPNCLEKIVKSPETGAQDVTNAFMDKNELFAKKNFGRSADNATAIIVYITKN